MNDKQKLLVMFGASSFLVFLITIFGLGFGSYNWIDSSKLDTSSERYERENPGTFDPDEFIVWTNKIRKEEGVKRYKFGIPLLFKRIDKINWLGIVACFNITFSLIGFFLFKDK